MPPRPHKVALMRSNCLSTAKTTTSIWHGEPCRAKPSEFGMSLNRGRHVFMPVNRAKASDLIRSFRHVAETDLHTKQRTNSARLHVTRSASSDQICPDNLTSKLRA